MDYIERLQIPKWLKRLRIHGLAVGLLNAIRDLRFRLSDDTRTLTISDAEAEFWTITRNEVSTLRNHPEQEVIGDLIDSLRPDDVFYDVGANIGVYSCLAASVLETDVIAFEPEPRNRDRLLENIRLNDAAIDVYEYALSDSAGTEEFVIQLFGGEHQTGPADHSFVRDHGDETETITIETVVGDELVDDQSLPVPTVMKIDVEGAEWNVLQGLESTLSRPEFRLLYCELHSEPLRSQGHTVEDVVSELQRMGFDVEFPFDPYDEPFLRAEKNQ